MSKKIYCHKCQDTINTKEDLVTAMLHLDVFPYHTDCYARDLKGGKSFFLNNQPINGIPGNFYTSLFVFIGLLLLIFGEGSLKRLAIVTLLPIAYRLYSYVSFERHV